MVRPAHAPPPQKHYSKRGGQFIWQLRADPVTFNVNVRYSWYASYVAGQIFNTLIEIDDKLVPQPCLAKSWDISKDGLTYTFNLRDDVKWHDGQPFTARDVKITYEMNRDYRPGSVFTNMMFEAPNPHTFVIRLKTPSPWLIYGLCTYYQDGIVPFHLYNGTDYLKNPYNDKPIGTGAYKFVERVRGSYIKLVKNENYWRKAPDGQPLPYMDELIIKIMPEPATAMAALMANEVDYITRAEFTDAKRVVDWKIPGLKVMGEDRLSGGSITGVNLNLRHPALGKKEVRHALSYALDKELIKKNAVYGWGQIATGPISSGTGDWYKPGKFVGYEYDKAKAEKLLDQAGYPRGPGGIRFALELKYTLSDPWYPAFPEMVSQMWNEVGVGTKLVQLEDATLREHRQNWNYEVLFDGRVTGPYTPAPMQERYSTKFIVKTSPLFNTMGYSNPVVDQLLDETVNEMDHKKAVENMGKFQDILREDVPYIWVWEEVQRVIVHERLEGFPTGLYADRMSHEGVYWRPETPPAVTTTTAAPARVSCNITISLPIS